MLVDNFHNRHAPRSIRCQILHYKTVTS